MKMVFDVVNYVLLIVLLFNIMYLAYYAIAGHFPSRLPKPVFKKNLRFAVFIPAYKGDEVILHTARQSLEQDYPKELYDIIVVGDSLQIQTLDTLETLPVNLIVVSFENSTKGKALNAAIEKVDSSKYDYAVILDIDNIMEVSYLTKLNERLQDGQLVMQTHRLAKNEDTRFSILDGISEEINNHIFRDGHKAVGVSAALIGSGKALAYPFFVEIMKDIQAVGGFDKEMEILILSRNVYIDYAHDILVYDEKVQKADIFRNQRRRWMSAQLTFMRKYAFSSIGKSIRTGNLDLFDKAIQLVLFPRILNLGIALILSLTWAFGNPYGSWFFRLFLIEITVLLISTPVKYFNYRTMLALINLPYAFVLMFLNLFGLKGADKKFIHTPHSTPDKKA